MLPSELERSAFEAWGKLLTDTAFPTSDWTLTCLSKRDDPTTSRISYLAAHPNKGRFTFKFQRRPHAPNAFLEAYRMQEQAFRAFPHSDQLTLPKPIFVDPETQSSLLGYVEGTPLAEAMFQARQTPQRQLDLLTQAGRWLDAYHRHGPLETRNFKPHFTVRYYTSLRDQILSGEKQVAARQLFLRGIKALAEMAPEFDNQPTIAAAQHGDFHMRNLIFDGTCLAGIDLSSNQPGPVGHDIAKFLLDYTSIERKASDLRPGQVVHDDAKEAFFQGYTVVGPNDPSVNFLLYSKILGELIHVQPDAKDRTLAKERTLARLRPIARNAFAMQGAAQDRKKSPISFYLTQNSLQRAQHGDHHMVNAFENLGRRKDRDVRLVRDTPHNRAQAGIDALSLVHMSQPIGPSGLVFRKQYAGAFYRIEAVAERWLWQLARAEFAPDQIDTTAAHAFFEHWRDRLTDHNAAQTSSDGFIYMPLQGKLLQSRSFQSMSPIDMITTTLRETDLPIVATLHPNETYRADELEALEDLQIRHPMFRVETNMMEDMLATCDLVVTQNSSAAFHGMFYKKPAVLFAGIDFHHICASVPTLGHKAAFAKAKGMKPSFEKYIYWFWKLNAIDLDEPGHIQKIIKRLKQLGWQI